MIIRDVVMEHSANVSRVDRGVIQCVDLFIHFKFYTTASNEARRNMARALVVLVCLAVAVMVIALAPVPSTQIIALGEVQNIVVERVGFSTDTTLYTDSGVWHIDGEVEAARGDRVSLTVSDQGKHLTLGYEQVCITHLQKERCYDLY